MGRSRGGLTTKIHAMVDAEGRPIRLALSEGQAHDGRSAEGLFDTLGEGHILLADRACDSRAARAIAITSCGTNRVHDCYRQLSVAIYTSDVNKRVPAMETLLKYFDPYSLRARVFPALIAGLPTLALIFVLVPWDHIGLPHATATAMGVVLLFAFADVGRRSGKSVEAKLHTRETPEQWHRGNLDVAEAAKDRYRAFIANQLKSTAPTADDEQAQTNVANDFYRSAGNWLREHTRNTKTFSILTSENITYGFRRNLLGLKLLSLIFNFAVLLICGAILYLAPPYFSQLPHIEEKMVIIIAAAVLHSLYMFFAVGKFSVIEASRTYGRQLILSCETLMKPAKTAPAKRKTKSDVGG